MFVDKVVCKLLVEQLNVDNVVFDGLLPIVLLDVEHDVNVDLFKIHSHDVRFCCSRRCCPDYCCELLVEQFFDLDVVVACVS